jgi:uncharacterized surface protein with fasciclin (FAS1) repeats
VRQSLRAGASEYLVKGADLEDLRANVARALAGRSRLCRLRGGQPERWRFGVRHGGGPGRGPASNNPLLKTLVAAVSGKLNPKVNLVDTLNGEFTVFAPVDDAFAKIDAATIEKLKTDDALKVNDANVICGGVHTANATVYLIDSVLMPTA